MKIAFYKAGGFWEGMIRFFTWGPYSHAELVFDDGDWFSSREPEGVRFTRIDPNPEEWDFIEVPISPEGAETVKAWCHQQHGKYDWSGLLHFAIPLIPKSTTRWFCSEICIEGLQQMGLLRGIESDDYSPNRFYRLVKRWPDGEIKPDRIPWPHLGR